MAPDEPALFEVEDHFELAGRDAVVLLGQVRRGVVAPGMWASRGGGDAGWAVDGVEIATRSERPCDGTRVQHPSRKGGDAPAVSRGLRARGPHRRGLNSPAGGRTIDIAGTGAIPTERTGDAP